MFPDIGNALKWMAIFAVIGLIAAFCGGGTLLYYLCKHLHWV